MKISVEFINAFSKDVFHGNSAAVVITEVWLPDNLMQQIASENNLSETAFVVGNSQGLYDIRWFSPLTEIDFCGHATLASAYVLFSRQPAGAKQTLIFSAPAVGEITVTQQADDYIQMNFPARKPVEVEAIPQQLLLGLSIKPQAVYLNQQAYFAVYSNESDVVNVVANSALIKELAPYDVIVTAAAANLADYDFVSRYFWPANGGDEDPVTGSAHAGLTPFWAEKLGKTSLSAFQASRRGGLLKCQLAGERVLVSGQAIRYLIGEITVPDY
ncbi:MAG: PhzF family phenazine biosynthesis protein [Thalassotalea sp.]